MLSSPSRLPGHATLRKGRLAAGTAEAPEAVVTTQTAGSLHLKPGSVVHVPSKTSPEPLAVTITGIVEPLGPQSPYWAVEPLLRTPALTAKVSDEIKYYWQGALLLSPDSAAFILSTNTEPELFFRYMPTAGHLTGRDTDRLASALDSAASGPDLVKLREAVGGNAALATDLDEIVDAYRSMREAINPVVAVAVFGIGTVAAVVLAMTGGLFVARRDSELALLRSRGASLTGIGLRLLGETSAVAVPAAALALGLAVLTVRPPGGSGGIPSPLRPRRRPRRPGRDVRPARTGGRPPPTPAPARGRDDLLTARPSRRRTVFELTLLVLAVGAVASLRLRGTDDGGDSGDPLVSAAPVLVGLIAASLLVRIYPLPLRWLARPAHRLRGAVGPLALARAGRARPRAPSRCSPSSSR
ncbi:hypothetical protein O1L60_13035 [Streptomyces diastatochromogenes]|nr:hypothetical protein [Streptomyces diastatochromogenes]